jgi:general stress protein 26
MDIQAQYPQIPQDLREKVRKMLSESATINVASISEDGFPRPCVVSRLGIADLNSIYFSTNPESNKARHFRANTKAGVCIKVEYDSVTFLGTMAVIEDLDLKERLWEDWMIRHFLLGPKDPDYCLFAFRPHTATIWIDKQAGIYSL